VILTVTLNPALDLTYEVDTLVPGGEHRVAEVHQRPGGKGVNVARILAALGESVTVTGLAGGATGTAVRAALPGCGVTDAFMEIGGETRRTVVVAEPATATGFWEPGPEVTAAEWDAFLAHHRTLVSTVDAVVLAGSLPPGVPVDAYAHLIGAAGVPTILDADGEALATAVAARPDVVKPNARELARLYGPDTDARDAGRRLRDRGAGAVVATLGSAGLVADTPEGVYRAAPPYAMDGNPTGAGDACTAALTIGLLEGRPWTERLRDATALSAASVGAPVAGEVDLARYRWLRRSVSVEPYR